MYERMVVGCDYASTKNMAVRAGYWCLLQLCYCIPKINLEAFLQGNSIDLLLSFLVCLFFFSILKLDCLSH